MNYLTPNLATQREILISPIQEDDKDLHRSSVDSCRTDEFEENRSLELIQQRSVAIHASAEPARIEDSTNLSESTGIPLTPPSAGAAGKGEANPPARRQRL